MGVRRLLTALTAALVSSPLALVATATPARAEEAWETALRSTMTRTTSWSQNGLSRMGPLARPLPQLDLSPGALVDVDQLVKKASDALAGTLTRDEDLGGGIHITSSVSTTGAGDHDLNVLLTTKRTVTGQTLHVSGVTVAGAVDVTGWATLALTIRHTAAGQTYLVQGVDGGSPRIDIDAAAKLRADLTQATASVGILGVALNAGSELVGRTHLKVTVADPDRDGRLAFDTAAGPDTGELAANGSLAGLVQVALDTSGGGRISDTETEPGPGSLHAVVKLGAAATGTSIALPPIDATVTVDWPDVSTGTPAVTTAGLDDTVAKFRNMSPLDLAAGLAQLAPLLTGVQQNGQAGNVSLPFLRGTAADAVKINERITGFLANHVHPRPEDPQFQPGVDDPAKAGQPKFSSLQELLKLLGDEGIPVSGVTFADD